MPTSLLTLLHSSFQNQSQQLREFRLLNLVCTKKTLGFICFNLLSFTMAVKWVLHWNPIGGSTVNTQIMNEIFQCVESLNGVKDGKWKSVLTFYKPITRDQSMAAEFPRDYLGILLPEQPNKYYLLIRGQRIVLEADLSIQTIMDKLQSYRSRVSLYFEGTQYKLGDFQVRVGKVAPSHSETMRGIIMEVEYLPISSVDKSKQILVDFVELWKDVLAKRSLPGYFLHIETNFGEYGLSDQYTSEHTAVQYATIMAKLIATVQQAGRS